MFDSLYLQRSHWCSCMPQWCVHVLSIYIVGTTLIITGGIIEWWCPNGLPTHLSMRDSESRAGSTHTGAGDTTSMSLPIGLVKSQHACQIRHNIQQCSDQCLYASQDPHLRLHSCTFLTSVYMPVRAPVLTSQVHCANCCVSQVSTLIFGYALLLK